MKTTNSRLRRGLCMALVLLLCMALLPMTALAAAAQASAATMRLVSYTGTVTVKNGSGQSKTLSNNLQLYNGWTVETGASSTATLSLDGSKAIRLNYNSKVELRQNTTTKKLDLFVPKGGITFDVSEKLPAGSSMNLSNGTLICGIRGTDGYFGQMLDDYGVNHDVLLVTDGGVVATKQGTAETMNVGTGQLLTDGGGASGLQLRQITSWDQMPALHARYMADSSRDHAAFYGTTGLTAISPAQADQMWTRENAATENWTLKQFQELREFINKLIIGSQSGQGTIVNAWDSAGTGTGGGVGGGGAYSGNGGGGGGEAVPVPKVQYAITPNLTAGGVLTVNGVETAGNAYAYENDTVTVTYTSDTGIYSLAGDVTMTNQAISTPSGNEGVYTYSASFTMPAGNVTLSEQALCEIYINCYNADESESHSAVVCGSISGQGNYAYAPLGEPVTLTVTPENSFRLESLTYRYPEQDEHEITKTGGVYSFTPTEQTVRVDAMFAMLSISIKESLQNTGATVTTKVGDDSVTTARSGDTVTLVILAPFNNVIKGVTVTGAETEQAVSLTKVLRKEYFEATIQDTYTFTMPDEPVVINGAKAPFHKVWGTGSDYGTVTVVSVDGLPGEAEYNSNYAAEGETVKLRSIPEEHYVLGPDGIQVKAGTEWNDLETIATLTPDSKGECSYTIPTDLSDVSLIYFDARFVAEDALTIGFSDELAGYADSFNATAERVYARVVVGGETVGTLNKANNYSYAGLYANDTVKLQVYMTAADAEHIATRYISLHDDAGSSGQSFPSGTITNRLRGIMNDDTVIVDTFTITMPGQSAWLNGHITQCYPLYGQPATADNHGAVEIHSTSIWAADPYYTWFSPGDTIELKVTAEEGYTLSDNPVLVKYGEDLTSTKTATLDGKWYTCSFADSEAASIVHAQAAAVFAESPSYAITPSINAPTGYEGTYTIMVGGNQVVTAKEGDTVTVSFTAPSTQIVDSYDRQHYAVTDFNVKTSAGGSPVSGSYQVPGLPQYSGGTYTVTYSFTMPGEAVTVYGAFTPAYEVTLQTTGDGSFGLSGGTPEQIAQNNVKHYAPAGKPVEVQVKPQNSGDVVRLVKVTDSSSNVVNHTYQGPVDGRETYRFTMSNGPVTVKVIVGTPGSQITLPTVSNGSIELYVNEQKITDPDQYFAAEGEAVRVEFTGDSDWEDGIYYGVGIVTVSNVNASNITATRTEDDGRLIAAYSFSMPAQDVTVSGSFAQCYALQIQEDFNTENGEIQVNTENGLEFTPVEPTYVLAFIPAKEAVTLRCNGDTTNDGWYCSTGVSLSVPVGSGVNDPTVTATRYAPNVVESGHVTTDYAFTMPAAQTSVFGRFAVCHSISSGNYNHGDVTVTGVSDSAEQLISFNSPADAVAAAGEIVHMTVTPDSGYALEQGGLTVSNASATAYQEVTEADGVYSFVMPEETAYINAKFS